MLFFVWERSLETGIDVIDSQHRRIVDYINQLYTAISQKRRDDIEPVLDALIDYTVTHFAFEEDLMRRAGYKHIDGHTAVHLAFRNRIMDYKQRFVAGEDVAKKLLSDLRVWLTNHIKREDGDYSGVVKAHLRNDSDKGWLSKTLTRFFG